MQAVIMAAGEGRRLEPLTEVRPKPMLPVANKPLLEHVISATVRAGVEEIVLVIGYEGDRIRDHFGDGGGWGVSIEYAEQPKQLGTGHAILQAEPFVAEPFLVLNGDRILDPSVIEVMRLAEPVDAALLAVTRSDQPSEYGVVEIEDRSVRSIVEKPPRSTAASDLINAGVYRFDRHIFDVLLETQPDAGELTVTAALERLAGEGHVTVVPYDGPWLDVSHHWDYLHVNAATIGRCGGSIRPLAAPHPDCAIAPDVVVGDGTTVEPHATLLSGTSIGENVRIGPNVVVENSVVFDDATVGAGAVVRDSVIAQDTTVGANTTLEGGLVDVVVHGSVHPDVRLGAVIGDHASIGAGVTVAPGTIIGTGATVETGGRVSDHVPPNAIVRGG